MGGGLSASVHRLRVNTEMPRLCPLASLEGRAYIFNRK